MRPFPCADGKFADENGGLAELLAIRRNREDEFDAVIGGRAIRFDMLERVESELDLATIGGADAAAILPKLVSLLGTSNDDAKPVLVALGWRLTDVKDASPVWRRRKERPRKAAPVKSQPHSPFAGLKELMVK